ncbi:MAG: NHLP leader peptide family RiPP precursor [Candidatus Binatia bacterium]|nr:NHLP leader peptide family RiPP precursor [Candidatus Binatia bacterium]
MADYTSRRDFEAKIVAKAWKDDAFRNELKANPKAVLERELKALYPDAALPADLDVKILEESPNEIFLVVPPEPAGATGSLSDEELGAVAGGTAVLVTVVVAATTVGVVNVDANTNVNVNANLQTNVNVNVNVG